MSVFVNNILIHTIIIAVKIAIPANLDCLVPINTSDKLTIAKLY
jgi:hypothetical protein